MRNLILSAALAAATTLGGCMAAPVAALETAGTEAAAATAEAEPPIPTNLNILFWTEAERDYGFRRMEELSTARTIARGDTVHSLPQGAPIAVLLEVNGNPASIEEYMAQQRSAGIVILHNGRIRMEEYRLGADADTRWTSFSVAKSLTSTLVGAAIRDGHIESLDAPVTQYIPELAGSGYDGVSIRQLLTMTSGVRWNEDYFDAQSDVSLFNQVTPEPGIDPIVSYMRNLPSEAEPGTRWQYNTGETNLIGVLVANATGRPLAQYLSEKVWAPYGMEQDGEWVLNAGGSEIGGCCISATVRDYARFGQFVIEGGAINGEGVVPDGWYMQAGRRQADIGEPGHGYGYQWWTNDDGSFAAQGIFGQGIFIDPARNLVIASNGNWDAAVGPQFRQPRAAFYRAVQAAIDREAGAER